jgi:hypothetical protein
MSNKTILRAPAGMQRIYMSTGLFKDVAADGTVEADHVSEHLALVAIGCEPVEEAVTEEAAPEVVASDPEAPKSKKQ